MTNPDRIPPRTLGISLAIFLSMLAYTVAPLVLVGFTMLLQARFRRTAIAVGTSDQFLGGTVGFTSVTAIELSLWVFGALAFTVIGAQAWWGRSQWRRYAFIAAVFVMPVWYGSLWTYRATQDQRFAEETGALMPQATPNSLCSAVWFVIALITLYIAWYMNRGPARAFYRGYYLDRETGQRENTA